MIERVKLSMGGHVALKDEYGFMSLVVVNDCGDLCSVEIDPSSDEVDRLVALLANFEGDDPEESGS